MSPACELARLYDAHAPALFAFLLDFTGHEADTRDLLQEVFIRLAQREDLLRGVESERGFLIRLARNLAIDSMRRREVRERKHEASPEPAEARANPDAQTLETALVAALQRLPEDQRAVVHLKLWGEMTFDEIADALSLSPNTAASRYRYGIDKLRAELRPLYDEIQ